jgi:hypothetical protein
MSDRFIEPRTTVTPHIDTATNLSQEAFGSPQGSANVYHFGMSKYLNMSNDELQQNLEITTGQAAPLMTKTAPPVKTAAQDTAIHHHVETQTKPAAHTNPTGHLVQAVFGNPQEFLKVLQNDADRIAKPNSSSITKEDLVDYSKTGPDARGRAAAKIAADHYPAFLDLARYPTVSNMPRLRPNVIYKSDLQADLALSDGQTHDLITNEEIKGVIPIVVGICIGAGSSVLGEALAPIPPLAVQAVRLGVSIGTGMIIRSGLREGEEAGEIHKYATTDQKTLASWAETNGSAAGVAHKK